MELRLNFVLIYTTLQDTELNDIKRVLFNCKLPILKEMFPDVSWLATRQACVEYYVPTHKAISVIINV